MTLSSYQFNRPYLNKYVMKMNMLIMTHMQLSAWRNKSDLYNYRTFIIQEDLARGGTTVLKQIWLPANWKKRMLTTEMHGEGDTYLHIKYWSWAITRSFYAALTERWAQVQNYGNFSAFLNKTSRIFPRTLQI